MDPELHLVELAATERPVMVQQVPTTQPLARLLVLVLAVLQERSTMIPVPPTLVHTGKKSFSCVL